MWDFNHLSKLFKLERSILLKSQTIVPRCVSLWTHLEFPQSHVILFSLSSCSSSVFSASSSPWWSNWQRIMASSVPPRPRLLTSCPCDEEKFSSKKVCKEMLPSHQSLSKWQKFSANPRHGFSGIPRKICPCPNPQDLWRWPYLKRFLQMEWSEEEVIQD